MNSLTVKLHEIYCPLKDLWFSSDSCFCFFSWTIVKSKLFLPVFRNNRMS